MIKKTTTARDVVLFIPNLIGYGRVLSTVGSFLLMVLFPNYWHVGKFRTLLITLIGVLKRVLCLHVRVVPFKFHSLLSSLQFFSLLEHYPPPRNFSN